MPNSVFQVLPTEIVASIFEYALVANYTDAGMFNVFYGSKPVLPVDCEPKPANVDHPHIAVSLLQVSREMYHLIRPMLFKVKKLEFSNNGEELLRVIKPSEFNCCSFESCVTNDGLPLIKDLVLRLDTVECKRNGRFGPKTFAGNLHALATRGRLRVFNLTIELVSPIWSSEFTTYDLAVALKGISVLSTLTVFGYGFSHELDFAFIAMTMGMKPHPISYGLQRVEWALDSLGPPDLLEHFQAWDHYLNWRETPEAEELYWTEMERRREAQALRVEKEADTMAKELGKPVDIYDISPVDPDGIHGCFAR
ncbi:MAG: hypothetical protein MMC33_003487 [Icmadophila ericetorum]|nr:hypothetical protein [Icmadophila ericetorum]